MRFDIKENATPEETNVLCEGLQVNVAETTPGLHPIKRFVILARDGDKIAGGAKGVTYYGCMYIDILWVDKPYRNQGLGSKLIQQAEQLGRERGCTFITLFTMSFEAPDFYLKQGYSVEFVREGYQGGHTCILLRKSI